MRFIQLHEMYYDTKIHGYSRRLVTCNVDAISDIRQGEHPDGYGQSCSVVSLTNGKAYIVSELYDAVVDAINCGVNNNDGK